MNYLDVLAEVWTDHMGRPKQYGESDCCQFIADYYRLMTGQQPPQFGYRNEEEAHAIIAAHGGISGIVESVLGDAHMPPLEGDIVVCELKNEVGQSVETPGVFNGKYVLGVIHARGPARFMARTIIAAWSV